MWYALNERTTLGRHKRRAKHKISAKRTTVRCGRNNECHCGIGMVKKKPSKCALMLIFDKAQPRQAKERMGKEQHVRLINGLSICTSFTVAIEARINKYLFVWMSSSSSSSSFYRCCCCSFVVFVMVLGMVLRSDEDRQWLQCRLEITLGPIGNDCDSTFSMLFALLRAEQQKQQKEKCSIE